MFDALRRMIFPIIVIVLLTFVGMIVLQWGMGMSSRAGYEQSAVAGIVNGEEVTWKAYNSVYNNLVRAEAQQTEDELPADKVKELQTKAWNQILSDRLMTQQVAKFSIVVTNEEVYAYLKYSPPADIQALPYFQTEGKFDYQKYLNALADNQMSNYWASLEPLIRSDLTKMKMQEMVIQNAHVSEEEVKEFFTNGAEKVKVEMIDVSFDRFSRPPPQSTDEEKRAFFEERRDDYSIEERAGLSIVMLERKAAPYDWEVSFNRATQLYDSIKAGADFAEIAKEFSEDQGSAVKGGDLDWFPRGVMVDEFDRLAFTMKEGEMSEPFRSQFGWHIIKHHGYKEEKVTGRGSKGDEPVLQAHCSHVLIKAEASAETLDGLYRRLEDFRTAALSSGFHKAAADAVIPLKESGLIFRNRNIQFIGRDIAASDFAFENEVGEISGVMENNSAIFVLQVSDRVPEGSAAYEDVEQKINLDIVKHKVSSLCLDTAAAIYADIRTGADFIAAAERFGETVETPDQFHRSAFVKAIGRDPKAIGAAFSLTEPGQYSPPTEHAQGVVMFRLIERITPDLTEYTTMHDSLFNMIMQAKQQELFSGWFKNLMESSEIVNNTNKQAGRSDFM
ncbi:MAG: peptidylprolyl isomerase [candidate division Zixibacteria bacterium]|nr:peptidylprolyl isomerase [candidate division Zixibacteria bacterium]MDH3936656.1 peptidylprolyl isomerase [candidate division Zixibacteria bacterium]MDH4032186.1 peptidylprolyl isomerase [candidate division Zixibacteria bacterium]